MQTELAETAGFCFGVDRAVALSSRPSVRESALQRLAPSFTTGM